MDTFFLVVETGFITKPRWKLTEKIMKTKKKIKLLTAANEEETSSRWILSHKHTVKGNLMSQL